jgi:hypothetical protein
MLALLAQLAVACGGHGAPQAIPHPAGHREVVLRLGEGGGMGTTEGFFSAPPAVVITGDGTTYVRMEEATTQGIVWPLIGYQVPESELQMLLREADRDGLLAAPPDYTPPGPISDAGDTTVDLAAGGGSWTHRANGLGDFDQETTARARLADFVAYLRHWTLTPGRTPRPREIHPQVLRVMAHPLPDGSTPPNGRVGRWPSDATVDLADVGDCTVVRDPVVVRMLTTGQAYAYRAAGQRYLVAAAVLLPGDSCADNPGS